MFSGSQMFIGKLKSQIGLYYNSLKIWEFGNSNNPMICDARTFESCRGLMEGLQYFKQSTIFRCRGRSPEKCTALAHDHVHGSKIRDKISKLGELKTMNNMIKLLANDRDGQDFCDKSCVLLVSKSRASEDVPFSLSLQSYHVLFSRGTLAV